MDALAPNPILTFNQNQMAKVRKLFGYDDLNRLNQDINLLEHWIKKQEHFMVKEFEKPYLERQLISSKGSIERTKKRLDKLCTLRGLMPEYLQDFGISNEFEDVLKVTNICLSPKPTQDNYRIILIDVHNPDGPISFNSQGVARYMLMCIEYLYCYDYSVGIELVCDTKNYTFGIVARLNPIVVANTLMLIGDALGLRLKGLHFIRGSKIIDTCMSVMTKCLSKKLMSRLHLHENYEALYQHVPKDLLPKDFGGDLETMKSMTENQFKVFSAPEFINKMKFIEKATTNEDKRMTSTFNEQYCGMTGAFKVLSVD